MSDEEQYEPLEHVAHILEKVAADYRALRAEVEKLRAAIKPFAESVGPETDMMSSAALSASIFTFGQLRAAAAALKETGDE